MAESLANEDQLGEGFAFFRWHTQEFPGGSWIDRPHPAYEQTECRRLFRKLNAPLAALDHAQEKAGG